MNQTIMGNGVMISGTLQCSKNDWMWECICTFNVFYPCFMEGKNVKFGNWFFITKILNSVRLHNLRVLYYIELDHLRLHIIQFIQNSVTYMRKLPPTFHTNTKQSSAIMLKLISHNKSIENRWLWIISFVSGLLSWIIQNTLKQTSLITCLFGGNISICSFLANVLTA